MTHDFGPRQVFRRGEPGFDSPHFMSAAQVRWMCRRCGLRVGKSYLEGQNPESDPEPFVMTFDQDCSTVMARTVFES